MKPQPPTTTITAIPPADVVGRIAALKTATTPELKQQWRELFGKEPPPGNRPYLESRLAYRIQELAYGGLKPETRARLEALGGNWTAATSCSVASAPTAARSPGHGCSASTAASSTS